MNEVGRWCTNPSIKTRIEYVEKNGIKRGKGWSGLNSLKKPSIESTVRKVVRVTECVYVVMGHNLVRFNI